MPPVRKRSRYLVTPPYASPQPVRDEVRVTKAAAAGHFLESLSQLQRGPGAELNAYLVRSLVITPIHPPHGPGAELNPYLVRTTAQPVI